VIVLNLRVTASSNSTLNPEVFVKCFCEYSGRTYEPELTRYCRTELYLKPEDIEIPII